MFMTVRELLDELKQINQERLLEAHHDDFYFQTFEDIDALNKVILLINYLNKKNPSDKVTVAELWEVAEIDS